MHASKVSVQQLASYHLPSNVSIVIQEASEEGLGAPACPCSYPYPNPNLFVFFLSNPGWPAKVKAARKEGGDIDGWDEELCCLLPHCIYQLTHPALAQRFPV